ncbi:hypothetical protein Taro_045661 [Colocasia esculenta]|uniref:Uncharacterized protein n=1 Tax=Colocasia esculenta TaxID=4460 RepID=A0A843WRU8_COLES|nr:hypothetical protein [Colocasia esculenta]
MAGPNMLLGLVGHGEEAKEEEISWIEGFIKLHPEFFKCHTQSKSELEIGRKSNPNVSQTMTSHTPMGRDQCDERPEVS